MCDIKSPPLLPKLRTANDADRPRSHLKNAGATDLLWLFALDEFPQCPTTSGRKPRGSKFGGHQASSASMVGPIYEPRSISFSALALRTGSRSNPTQPDLSCDASNLMGQSERLEKNAEFSRFWAGASSIPAGRKISTTWITPRALWGWAWRLRRLGRLFRAIILRQNPGAKTYPLGPSCGAGW